MGCGIMRFMKKLAALFCFLCYFSGCLSHSQSSSLASPKLDSETAQEIAIGEQIHATILQSFYPYTDPKVVNYINQVGNALAIHSERRSLPYRFTILYSDKIYATSAPGGFIYLTTGMLYFVENESELAAVLAHEIGELQFRDPENKNAQRILDSLTRGGAMVAPMFGSIGALAAVGLVAVNNLSQPHPITQEMKLIQADQKALHYMVEANQDPQAMLNLEQKFLRAKGEVIPYFYDYYKSRPITEERFLALNKTFAGLPLTGKTFETRREIYQEMTKGVREIYKQ